MEVAFESNGLQLLKGKPRIAQERKIQVNWTEVLEFIDTMQVNDVYQVILPEGEKVRSFRVVVSRFGTERGKKFSVLTSHDENGDEIIEIVRRR